MDSAGRTLTDPPTRSILYAVFGICSALGLVVDAVDKLTAHSGALVRDAGILRALAHPTRLAILEELSLGEECVCHLSHVLARPQPYISKQLAELRDACLVDDRRDGPRIYYRLTDDRVAGVLGAVRGLSGRQPPAARRSSAGCPCPRCGEPDDRPDALESG
jgi:ArsR family transcriptional regulator